MFPRNAGSLASPWYSQVPVQVRSMGVGLGSGGVHPGFQIHLDFPFSPGSSVQWPPSGTIS